MPAKPAANINYVGGDKNIRGNQILPGKVGMTFQLPLFIWEALMSQFSSVILSHLLKSCTHFIHHQDLFINPHHIWNSLKNDLPGSWHSTPGRGSRDFLLYHSSQAATCVSLEMAGTALGMLLWTGLWDSTITKISPFQPWGKILLNAMHLHATLKSKAEIRGFVLQF